MLLKRRSRRSWKMLCTFPPEAGQCALLWWVASKWCPHPSTHHRTHHLNLAFARSDRTEAGCKLSAGGRKKWLEFVQTRPVTELDELRSHQLRDQVLSALEHLRSRSFGPQTADRFGPSGVGRSVTDRDRSTFRCYLTVMRSARGPDDFAAWTTCCSIIFQESLRHSWACRL